MTQGNESRRRWPGAPRLRRGVVLCLWAIAATAAAGPAQAIKMTLIGDQLTVSGAVYESELPRFVRILNEEGRKVTTIVFRNSPGGSADTAYRISTEIRTRGLTTAVSGYCVSACSIMFMGGIRRLVMDDSETGKTYVGFHGTVQGLPGGQGYGAPSLSETAQLRGYFLGRFGDKSDAALIDRWLALSSMGLVLVYHPDRLKRPDQVTIFLCVGTEKNFADCEKIAGKNGYDIGVFTTKDVLAVNVGPPE